MHNAALVKVIELLYSISDTLSQSVTRDNTTTEHKEKTNLDSILGNIKSDIKSFMDSVKQHQEDIISDIGMCLGLVAPSTKSF